MKQTETETVSKSACKKGSWTFRQAVSQGRAGRGFLRGHPSGPKRATERPRRLPTPGEGWPETAVKREKRRKLAKLAKTLKTGPTEKLR